MVSVPPDSTVTLLTAWPEKTVSVVPLLRKTGPMPLLM